MFAMRFKQLHHSGRQEETAFDSLSGDQLTTFTIQKQLKCLSLCPSTSFDQNISLADKRKQHLIVSHLSGDQLATNLYRWSSDQNYIASWSLVYFTLAQSGSDPRGWFSTV